jgi:hypothetical protein
MERIANNRQAVSMPRRGRGAAGELRQSNIDDPRDLSFLRLAQLCLWPQTKPL